MSQQHPQPSRIPRPISKKTPTCNGKDKATQSCGSAVKSWSVYKVPVTRLVAACHKGSAKPGYSAEKPKTNPVAVKNKAEEKMSHKGNHMNHTNDNAELHPLPHHHHHVPDGKDKDQLKPLGVGTKFESFQSLAQDQDPKVAFEPDEKALESILSNKGITADLASSRSTLEPQTGSRLSLYYQSPSRMSLVDSYNLFKDKMKFVKEKMKALNLKPETEATANCEKLKTPISSSARPVSLYFKRNTPGSKDLTQSNATPEGSRLLLRKASLSERKRLKPQDLNSERLCQTAYKRNSRFEPCSLSQSGKENKSQFKLFPSPIHEVPENSSPVQERLVSLNPASSTSHSLGSSAVEMLGKSSNPTENVGSSDTATAAEGITSVLSTTNHPTQLPQFTSLNLSPNPSLSNHPMSSSSLSTSRKCATTPTPPQSTWTVQSTICTPSLVPNSRETTTDQPLTPTLKNTKDINSKANELRSPCRTPSRIMRKTEGGGSLVKGPQRTPVTVYNKAVLSRVSSQDSHNGTPRAPFLCSYLRTKLETGH